MREKTKLKQQQKLTQVKTEMTQKMRKETEEQVEKMDF